MSKKVLVIVDLQNDFCPGGSLAVNEGDQIVPLVKDLALRGNYDLVIATQDWHPQDHASFAANHAGKNVFESVDLDGIQQTLWPVHCVQDTKGAELHADLTNDLEFVKRLDTIVTKGTNPRVDSYSAFFDNNQRQETGLRQYLQQFCAINCIQPKDLQVDFTGLALDYCVKFSALDAAKIGFSSAVVLDATRAVNLSPNDDLNALRELTQAGVSITSSREILAPVVEREPARPKAVALNP